MFDYIKETGKFSEILARTCFHQIMNALYCLHSHGYAHRDLKPENILLAKDYIIKVTDFGFACSLKGKDQKGILHTKVGTQGYMAPEVYKQSYVGTQADIFSAGVIPFIMHAGTASFEKANSSDPYFQLIAAKNYNLFI